MQLPGLISDLIGFLSPPARACGCNYCVLHVNAQALYCLLPYSLSTLRRTYSL